MRYIRKEVEPPDTNEVCGVFDLKWFKDLGNECLILIIQKNRTKTVMENTKHA